MFRDFHINDAPVLGPIKSVNPLRGLSGPLAEKLHCFPAPQGRTSCSPPTPPASAATKEDELHWLALCLIPGLGTVKAGKLIAQFRSPQAIFRASRSELESHGLSGSVAQTIASGCTFDDAVDQQQKMLESGAALVPISDASLSGAAARDLRSAHRAVRARPSGAAAIHHAGSGGYQASYRVWNGGGRASGRRSGASGTHDCERHGARHRYRGPSRGARRRRRHHRGVRLRRGSYLSGRESEAGRWKSRRRA